MGLPGAKGAEETPVGENAGCHRTYLTEEPIVSKKRDEARTFEQPKGDTPLARAMSIPWVAEGIKPSCITPKAGYPNPDGWSELLLVWVKGNGPALGRFVSATSRFVISGYGAGFEVTHWAYISEPK